MSICIEEKAVMSETEEKVELNLEVMKEIQNMFDGIFDEVSSAIELSFSL